LHTQPSFAAARQIASQMTHVSIAGKVNLGELSKDMGTLRAGIKALEVELAWHQKNDNPVDGDCFAEAVEEFLKDAREQFHLLDKQFNQISTDFAKLALSFGYDEGKVEPDELFGIFDQFIQRVDQARSENAEMKKKEEEERRREAERQAEAEKKVSLLCIDLICVCLCVCLVSCVSCKLTSCLLSRPSCRVARATRRAASSSTISSRRSTAASALGPCPPPTGRASQRHPTRAADARRTKTEHAQALPSHTRENATF
jgi:hypothetical protein